MVFGLRSGCRVEGPSRAGRLGGGGVMEDPRLSASVRAIWGVNETGKKGGDDDGTMIAEGDGTSELGRQKETRHACLVARQIGSE